MYISKCCTNYIFYKHSRSARVGIPLKVCISLELYYVILDSDPFSVKECRKSPTGPTGSWIIPKPAILHLHALCRVLTIIVYVCILHMYICQVLCWIDLYLSYIIIYSIAVYLYIAKYMNEYLYISMYMYTFYIRT